jgi:hypothetical protein
MDPGRLGLVDDTNILEWEVIIMGYVVLATLCRTLLTSNPVLLIRFSKYSVQMF